MDSFRMFLFVGWLCAIAGGVSCGIYANRTVIATTIDNGCNTHIDIPAQKNTNATNYNMKGFE